MRLIVWPPLKVVIFFGEKQYILLIRSIFVILSLITFIFYIKSWLSVRQTKIEHKTWSWSSRISQATVKSITSLLSVWRIEKKELSNKEKSTTNQYTTIKDWKLGLCPVQKFYKKTSKNGQNQ